MKNHAPSKVDNSAVLCGFKSNLNRRLIATYVLQLIPQGNHNVALASESYTTNYIQVRLSLHVRAMPTTYCIPRLTSSSYTPFRDRLNFELELDLEIPRNYIQPRARFVSLLHFNPFPLELYHFRYTLKLWSAVFGSFSLTPILQFCFSMISTRMKGFRYSNLVACFAARTKFIESGKTQFQSRKRWGLCSKSRCFLNWKSMFCLQWTGLRNSVAFFNIICSPKTGTDFYINIKVISAQTRNVTAWDMNEKSDQLRKAYKLESVFRQHISQINL